MKPVRYFPVARIEFDEAFFWYAQRSEKAALDFVEAIDESTMPYWLSPFPV